MAVCVVFVEVADFCVGPVVDMTLVIGLDVLFAIWVAVVGPTVNEKTIIIKNT